MRLASLASRLTQRGRRTAGTALKASEAGHQFLLFLPCTFCLSAFQLPPTGPHFCPRRPRPSFRLPAEELQQVRLSLPRLSRPLHPLPRQPQALSWDAMSLRRCWAPPSAPPPCILAAAALAGGQPFLASARQAPTPRPAPAACRAASRRAPTARPPAPRRPRPAPAPMARAAGRPLLLAAAALALAACALPGARAQLVEGPDNSTLACDGTEAEGDSCYIATSLWPRECSCVRNECPPGEGAPPSVLLRAPPFACSGPPRSVPVSLPAAWSRSNSVLLRSASLQAQRRSSPRTKPVSLTPCLQAASPPRSTATSATEVSASHLSARCLPQALAAEEALSEAAHRLPSRAACPKLWPPAALCMRLPTACRVPPCSAC